jgi:hypothetical protein
MKPFYVTAAVLLLMSLGSLGPAAGEIKCQTSSGPCLDTRTNETRTCTTKVCTDDNGKIVSTESTIALKRDGNSSTSKPKAPVSKIQKSGTVKQ